MKSGKLSLIGYFVLVFLGGGVVGALSQRLYTATTVNAKPQRRSPEEYRNRYIEEMKTRLKLDDGQSSQLNVILNETEEKFRTVRQKMDPEMKAIRNEQVDRVNGILNEDQKKEYQKMRDERADRMKKSQPPRSGAPGGC
jgi:hypothetical protein